jgi:hypothetical protein
VNIDKMEMAIDRLDNCVAMIVNLTTISDKTHVTSLRESLPEIAAELRAALSDEPG